MNEPMTDTKADLIALADELEEAASVEADSQGSTTTINTLRKAARALRAVPNADEDAQP